MKSIINPVPPYVLHFIFIKPTPVQPLAAAVTKQLVLTFHSDFTPWTLWKFGTPPIRAYSFHLHRPSVGRGEQKLIQYSCGTHISIPIIIEPIQFVLHVIYTSMKYHRGKRMNCGSVNSHCCSKICIPLRGEQ